MRVPAWLSKLIFRLESVVDRYWAVPALAALAGLDLFIMVVPTEWILISTVMLRPKRWWTTALWLTTGSAIGAFLLGYAVQNIGPHVVDLLFEKALQTAFWLQAESWIDHYGAPALAVIAVSPLPQQPAVAIAALGKMAPWTIFAMIWLGRFPKYIVFAWLATHAPAVLTKIGVLKSPAE